MDSRRQITGTFTNKRLENLFQCQVSEKQTVADSTAFKELLSNCPIFISTMMIVLEQNY